MAIRYVELSRRAQKQIRRLPAHIIEKLQVWIHAVSLSRGYRAIYIVKKNASIEFVSVEEVNLHDY